MCKYFLLVLSTTLIMGCSNTQLGALGQGLKAVNNSFAKPGGLVQKSCEARNNEPDSRFDHCIYSEIERKCFCEEKGTSKKIVF